MGRSPCNETHTPRLIDTGEVDRAVAWRLAGWDAPEIAACVEAVGIALEDGEPLASLLSMVRRDRRTPWTAVCALTVQHARQTGDTALYWRAGAELVFMHRRDLKRGDSPVSTLTAIVARYRHNRPRDTADQCFDHLAQLAGVDPVLADFDADRDTLVYAARSGILIDVSRASFRRQWRRMTQSGREIAMSAASVTVSSADLQRSGTWRAG